MDTRNGRRSGGVGSYFRRAVFDPSGAQRADDELTTPKNDKVIVLDRQRFAASFATYMLGAFIGACAMISTERLWANGKPTYLH
jgi:hypothetical protein